MGLRNPINVFLRVKLHGRKSKEIVYLYLKPFRLQLKHLRPPRPPPMAFGTTLEQDYTVRINTKSFEVKFKLY